jgi:hypothetical protein
MPISLRPVNAPFPRDERFATNPFCDRPPAMRLFRCFVTWTCSTGTPIAHAGCHTQKPREFMQRGRTRAVRQRTASRGDQRRRTRASPAMLLLSQAAGAHVLIFELGSYVTHAKMPDLGSGEILAAEKGRVCIRFGSGDRHFVWELVQPHLTVTAAAPERPPQKPKRTRKAAAPKV